MDSDIDITAIARTATLKASCASCPCSAWAVSCPIRRVNVSFAATQMNADLGFSATIYGLGSGLFLPELRALRVPSGMVVTRVGPRLWIARIMLTWGLLAAGMMFVSTPTQFYVMRFLLGMAEAGYFPCAAVLFAQWFPAAHRGHATSHFYVSAAFRRSSWDCCQAGCSAWTARPACAVGNGCSWSKDFRPLRSGLPS